MTKTVSIVQSTVNTLVRKSITVKVFDQKDCVMISNIYENKFESTVWLCESHLSNLTPLFLYSFFVKVIKLFNCWTVMSSSELATSSKSSDMFFSSNWKRFSSKLKFFSVMFRSACCFFYYGVVEKHAV